MNEFEELILKKFCVMPFKNSSGKLCLAGKGVSYSYEKSERLEGENKAKDNRIAELEKERSEFIECLELLNNKVIGREYGLDSEEIWEITKKFLNENTEKSNG